MPHDTPACLDCGAPIHGAYCHACGQRHEPALKSLWSLLLDTVADLTNWDARLYRTLRSLVTAPGFLTTEYLIGRRTRHVTPFRLYLGVSALYFAVFIATGSSRFFVFWTGGPDTALAPLVRLLPRLMFLFVPLFAGLVALLNRRSGQPYTAHVVFALHVHAFAFLVLPLASLLQPVLRRLAAGGDIGNVGMLLLALSSVVELSVVLYLYLALRRVYRDRPLRAVAKTVLLFASYMVLLAGAALVLLLAARDAVLA